MRNIPTSRLYYRALSQVAKRVDRVLQRASDRIGALLQSYGTTIPRQYETAVVNQAGSIVQRVFVGSDGRQSFGDDGITPLSPYARELNILLATVQAQVVQKHADSIERMVTPELAAWLRSATIELTSEFNHLFPPAYEAAHTWVDPNGYRLSDRNWRTSLQTRQRIDALLTEGIRQERSSTALQRDLEAFLLPSRKWRRTNAPYGRDASFDAMRLARTEISRAHSQATFAAAQANPFVNGMDWALSARHPRIDICDDLATIGMSGQRIKPPYPLASAPMVVADSHPQCICNNRPALVEDVAVVRNELTHIMQTGRPAPITPLASMFLSWLIGDLLRYVVNDWSEDLIYA